LEELKAHKARAEAQKYIDGQFRGVSFKKGELRQKGELTFTGLPKTTEPVDSKNVKLSVSTVDQWLKNNDRSLKIMEKTDDYLVNKVDLHQAAVK
jgi:hypothetical protein